MLFAPSGKERKCDFFLYKCTYIVCPYSQSIASYSKDSQFNNVNGTTKSHAPNKSHVVDKAQDNDMIKYQQINKD